MEIKTSKWPGIGNEFIKYEAIKRLFVIQGTTLNLPMWLVKAELGRNKVITLGRYCTEERAEEVMSEIVECYHSEKGKGSCHAVGKKLGKGTYYMPQR